MSLIAIIIVVILICSAMSDSAAAKDWERSEELAEMRHQELMELERENHKELKRELHEIKSRQKRSLPEKSYVNRKRYITDHNGNILAEEILVSSGKSYSFDDVYDDYQDDFDDDLDYDDFD